MSQPDDLDYVESMIDACGSATGLFDAAVEIRYQCRVRKGQKGIEELEGAYEIVKKWCSYLAGVDEDLAKAHMDNLIDRSVSLPLPSEKKDG